MAARNLKFSLSYKLFSHDSSLTCDLLLLPNGENYLSADRCSSKNLNGFDLPVFEFHGRRTAEDVNHHCHSTASLVDAVDLTLEILERSFVDFHAIAHIEVDLQLGRF